MKTQIALLVTVITSILFWGGCATPPETQSVAGMYRNGDFILLLKKDALAEAYKEGSRGEDAVADAKGHWELVNGEIRLTFKKEQKDNTFVRIYIINPDSSIREIGFLIDGKQSDTPKDKQPTYQKIL